MTAKFILPFDRITAENHGRVGGKCASLGEMTRHGVAVPPGFAITTDAYSDMLAHQGLRAEIEALLKTLGPDDVVITERVARNIELRVRSHPMPAAVEAAIRDAYGAMGADMAVAVAKIADVATSRLGQRVVFAETLGHGMGASEAGKSAANAEVTALADEVLTKLQT